MTAPLTGSSPATMRFCQGSGSFIPRPKGTVMRSGKLMYITAMTLITLLTIPVGLAAQANQGHRHEHPNYKVIDMGTFGGPNGNVNPGTAVLNKQGAVVGSADTTIPDPYAPNCFNEDCFVSHAFRWKERILADLSSLPGGYSSLA